MFRKCLAVLLAISLLLGSGLTTLPQARAEVIAEDPGAPAVTTSDPTEKPGPSASDPTAEAEPADTPEPTMEPEPSAAPEPTDAPEPSQSPDATATPEAEATGEPLPTPAPLFERGYARVEADTSVYTEEDLQEKLGELSDACVVYAHGRRANRDGLPDWLAIAFGTADGVVSGFIRADKAEPLTPDELDAYLAKLDTGWAWDGQYPLEQAAFEPNLAETPEPGTQEETESPTPAPEGTTKLPSPGEGPTENPVPQPAVSITAEPSPLVIGETVTLRAVSESLATASWQWQASVDGVAWTDIEGADGPAYSFVSDEVNAAYHYRVLRTELPAPPAVGLLAEGGEPDPKAKDDPTGDALELASPPLTLLVAGLGVAKILSTGKLYLTLPEAVTAAVSGDTIEVVHDISLTQIITVIKTLSLVASGDRVVTGRGHQRMFTVTTGGDLRLGETGGGLTIDANGAEESTGGCVWVGTKGSLSLYGQATITGGHANRGGGVIVYGTMYMSGGTVTGNTATSGGGVSIYPTGSLWMTGGVIRGNSSTNEGGGLEVSGTLELSGGEISGNSASYGGGIVLNDGRLTLSGGRICGNTSVSNDGIRWVGGDLSVSGEAAVEDAVHITSDTHRIGVTTTGSNKFTGSMRIQPYGYSGGEQILTALTTGTYTNDILSRFSIVPLDATKSWKLDGNGKLAQAMPGAVAEVDGVPYLTFVEAMNAANAVSGDSATVTLLADASLTTPATVIAGTHITVRSSGAHTLTRTFTDDQPMFSVATGGELALGGGGGALTLDAASAASGCNIRLVVGVEAGGALKIYDGATLTGGFTGTGVGGGVYARGTVDMRGGTVANNYAWGGGGIYIAHEGSLRMSGGVIRNNEAAFAGGGLAIDSTHTSISISGGEIAANRAGQYGGGVYLFNAALILSGGFIHDNDAYEKGSGIYLAPSSNPRVSLSDHPIVEGEVRLADGNQRIAVTTEGSGAFIGRVTVWPASYSVGEQVLAPLASGAVYPAEIRSCIAVMPNGAESSWTLDEHGKLAMIAAVATIGDTSYPTFQQAWTAANEASGSAVITLLSDVTLPEPVSVSANNHISIIASGSRVIKRGFDYDTAMFQVNKSGELSLGESGGALTLDAQSVVGQARRVVQVNSGGVLKVFGHATLRGGYATRGSGIYVRAGGTLQMSGGEITGNTATEKGGGVYLEGTMDLTGGSFSANTAPLGGGVYTNATSSAKLNTAGLFTNSTLYFESAPVMDQPVRLTFGQLYDGEYVVQQGDWVSTSWFKLVNTPNGILSREVMEGTGGIYALRFYGPPEVEVSVADVPYGTPPAPTATVTRAGKALENAKVTFTYGTKATGPFSATEPKKPGAYYVKGQFAGDPARYYLPGFGIAQFSIGKALPTVALADLNATYTGKPIPIGNAAVLGPDGKKIAGKLTYDYFSDGDCVIKLADPPSAPGIYYAKATVAEQANYLPAISPRATLTIDRLTGFAASLPDSVPRIGSVYQLVVGEAFQILREPTPAGMGYTLSCSSDNKKAVTVSSSGLVKAVGPGDAKVTATAKAKAGGWTFSVPLDIHVGAGVISVKLPSEMALTTGQMKKLTAVLSFKNAPDKTLTWTSGKPGVAIVGTDGMVTAIAPGTAHIRATAPNGRDAECIVYVVTLAQSVAFSVVPGKLNVGKTLKLKATVEPAGAEKALAWKSSNAKCAAVDDDGLVTGLKAGTATITATTQDGSKKSASVKVTVVMPVTSVTVPATATVLPGKTIKLAATVSPSKATNKALIWTSSDACATVDAKGNAKGIASGTAIITATADNGVAGSCIVTVSVPVNGITLSTANGHATLYTGEAVKLLAEVMPTETTNKALGWRSSNAKCAAVDANGFVTGVKAGTAVIYAKAADGSGTQGQISLTVVSPAKSIALNKTSAELSLSGTKTLALTATVPKGTGYRTLIWAVVEGDAVIVNDQGLVTAVKEGTATVWVSTDYGVCAECTFTVLP